MSGSGGEDRASGRSSVETGTTEVAAVAQLSHVLSQGLSLDDPGGGSGGTAKAAAVSSSGENQVDYVADLGGSDSGSDFLLDAVLSWTVAEATDVEHYESKIKTIPEQFKSINHYKEVQSYLLIEEVRAKVHSAIKQIEKAEFYNILSVLDIDSSELLFFDIDVEKLSRHELNHHSTKDGDVFLLTMESPADGQLDTSWSLGIAMEVGEDNCFQKSFRMLVSRRCDRCLVKSVKFVSFLTNIAEEFKISHSISFGDFNAIQLILDKNKSSITSCSETEQLPKQDRYNQAQVDCISSILSKLRCEQSVQLVWGSRGTGKTWLCCTLIMFLINSGKKVMVCVPTEESISVFINQLKTEFPEFEVSNLIVLNSFNQTFSATHLKERSHELYCATYLWKAFTKKLAQHLRLEIYMPKEQPIGEEASVENMVQFSFDSFKRIFITLLKEVKHCSNALISSLSGKWLSEQDVNKVNSMVSMLLTFQERLEDDATRAVDVQRSFGIPETAPYTSKSNKTDPGIANDINDQRNSCIGLMQDLLGAIIVPKLNSWKDLEKFCLKHSKIVVCTPGSSSQLRNLEIKPDILIVDDAAQIRESVLLVPLSTGPSHILLVGDHLHVQPMVESKVCKKAGYGISLFERLINLSFDKKILRQQYVMNPVLSKLHGELFYQDEILDGLNVIDGHFNFLKDLRYGPYVFFDISDVKELRSDGPGFVESSLIMMLLGYVYTGLKKSKESARVAVVCLCSNRANTLRDELSVQYEGHNEICVEVIYIDRLHKAYDIVILSSVCTDPNVLLEGNRLNVFLSSSRHCIWIVGEAGIFLSSNEALDKLVQQNSVFRTQSHILSHSMQQLKLNNKKFPAGANSTCQNFSSHKTGQEYKWKGRPYKTKNIMPPVRDQKDDIDADTCSLNTVLGVFESSKKVQYADFDPPEDFEFSMSLPHLKEQYERRVGAKFLETENFERGKRRLEIEMDILQKHGVKGSNKIDSKEDNFKISRYERLELKDDRLPFLDIKEHVRAAKMLACHFRISSNYFYLKPGECYKFDETRAIIHPISQLPVSHAVMGTGFGLLRSAVPKGRTRTHVAFQNSEGCMFGFDGSGTVLRVSLRGAYIMSPGEDSSIIMRKQSTAGAKQEG